MRLLLSILLLAGTAFSQHPVSRVIDGDTVELMMDGALVKVRLIGVDTPETVHPSKPVQYYGMEASAFTRNLLRGESVFVESTGTDRYGRLLAYLYRAPDRLFVNAEIIRQGYGHAYTKYPFKHQNAFVALQVRAREVGKGLWAGQASLRATDRAIDADADKYLDSLRAAPWIAPKTAKTHDHATYYVTASGKKYHRDGCRYLKKSRIPKRASNLSGYSPCKVCRP